MDAGEWLHEAQRRLKTSGVPHPGRDALLLLADATAADKAAILAHPERQVPEKAILSLESRLSRREAREPLQYIRGFHEFWGRRIRVGPGCLIPRPETEHLVESSLDLLRGLGAPRIAEAGTGSGAVLLALSVERPDAVLIGFEREPEALAWSRANLRGRPNVRLVRGDFSAPPLSRELDLVVSNPPYVTDPEWDALPPEVRLFEPESSLRCGPDPLSPYRLLGDWAARSLRPGGHLLCEIGVAQARRLVSLRTLNRELEWVGSKRDLAGRLRVCCWRRP